MMKNKIQLLFVLVTTAVFFIQFAIQPPKFLTNKIPVKGYQLVWQDEFNGTSLNLTKWNYTLGKRRDAINAKETVFLNGKGCLHLQVKKKGDSTLAAMISTEKKFETTYGYFECRAKLTKALGIWPAFWLLSGTNYDYGTPEKNGIYSRNNFCY